MQTLEGHSGWVCSVAFSPDSKVLASSSKDKTVKLWDVGTGALRHRLKLAAVILIRSFTDDGKFLKTTKVMLCITPFPLCEVFPHQDLSSGVSFEEWITRGAENAIWVPSEYRPHCCGVLGALLLSGTGLVACQSWNWPLRVILPPRPRPPS